MIHTSLIVLLRCLLASRATLTLENLALRQQLAVLRRQVKRPQFKARDRAFWVLLAKLRPGWRGCLFLVQPATVISWQRTGFRLFWRIKSRSKPGRPRAPTGVQRLIREMSTANRLWGAPVAICQCCGSHENSRSMPPSCHAKQLVWRAAQRSNCARRHFR